MTAEERPTSLWEGSICYPPVLGFEPGAGNVSPRARLANTLLTPSGENVTVVFRGDRAEVAERLMVRGSVVRLAGAWDEARAELAVDRFEVDGIAEPHRYRLDTPPAGEVAAEVDVATLYETTPTDRTWPEGMPPPPSEEFAGQEPETNHSPTPAAGLRDGPASVGAEPAVEAGRQLDHGFVPGQRVIARDRGNVGTVVSVDDGAGQVMVRFVAQNGTTAVVGFSPDKLEAQPRRAASAAAAAPQPAPDPALKPGRRAAGPGDRGVADPVIGVLRVHTRRPEPSGEILL